jgi:hypothetical protein
MSFGKTKDIYLFHRDLNDVNGLMRLIKFDLLSSTRLQGRRVSQAPLKTTSYSPPVGLDISRRSSYTPPPPSQWPDHPLVHFADVVPLARVSVDVEDFWIAVHWSGAGARPAQKSFAAAPINRYECAVSHTSPGSAIDTTDTTTRNRHSLVGFQSSEVPSRCLPSEGRPVRSAGR